MVAAGAHAVLVGEALVRAADLAGQGPRAGPPRQVMADGRGRRLMVRVKICGITSLEDAMVCVEAGADALGFIFVEGTPRFVTPAQVAPIVRALPPFVTPVGVFWDHPAGSRQGGGRGVRASRLAVPRR